MIISGNKIKSFTANDGYPNISLKDFLKNKEFEYLNIIYLGNDRYRILYIVVTPMFEEPVEIIEELPKERLSI